MRVRMKDQRAGHIHYKRGLAPVVGAGMAAVAAGSLVLFSVLAQNAALTPGPGAIVIPHTAPPSSGRSVINVPEPTYKIPVPPISNASFPLDAGTAPTTAPDAPPTAPAEAAPATTIVASLNFGVETTDEDDSPVPGPRPKIQIGRNLNPPDRDDPDDDDDDPDDTDGDGTGGDDTDEDGTDGDSGDGTTDTTPTNDDSYSDGGDHDGTEKEDGGETGDSGGSNVIDSNDESHDSAPDDEPTHRDGTTGPIAIGPEASENGNQASPVKDPGVEE